MKFTAVNVSLSYQPSNVLWLWEKSVIRDCNYKNHRRFTLRCISKGIVPVSVRLGSSCSKISKQAREIIWKAEKQLLQDRFKCINATIKHNGSNINNNRSRLTSIVTNTADIDQCSKFINKVRGGRFSKIKDRQVNKFNILEKVTIIGQIRTIKCKQGQ